MLDRFEKGWPSRENFASHARRFLPFTCTCSPVWATFGCRLVALGAADRATVVSVATAPSSNAEAVFHGDAVRQESVRLPLGAFCAAFGDAEHWVRTNLGGLPLYLSQCTLYSASPATCPADVPDTLWNALQQEVLARDPAFPLRAAAAPEEEEGGSADGGHLRVQQVNLWMGIGPTTSSFHYDNSHNILVVLQGRKTVRLLSPEHTAVLQPFPATSLAQGSNHCHASDVPAALDTAVATATLEAGDALFIPEGWWHEVRSDAGTVALNFWFAGPVATLLADCPQVLPYVLRCCAHGLAVCAAERAAGAATSADADAAKWDDAAFAAFMHRLHTALVPTAVDGTGHKRGRDDDDNDDDALEATFTGCSLADMQRLWPGYATRHADTFADVLLALSPQSAQRLLATWDSCADGAFFEELFRPCGSRTPAIRAHLVRQADAFVQAAASRTFHGVLGTPLPA